MILPVWMVLEDDVELDVDEEVDVDDVELEVLDEDDKVLVLVDVVLVAEVLVDEAVLEEVGVDVLLDEVVEVVVDDVVVDTEVVADVVTVDVCVVDGDVTSQFKNVPFSWRATSSFRALLSSWDRDSPEGMASSASCTASITWTAPTMSVRHPTSK